MTHPEPGGLRRLVRRLVVPLVSVPERLAAARRSADVVVLDFDARTGGLTRAR